MKKWIGRRVFSRPAFKFGKFSSLALASSLLLAAGFANSAEAGSQFCPTCNLQSSQISNQPLAPSTGIANRQAQNISSILNAAQNPSASSRLQYTPMPGQAGTSPNAAASKSTASTVNWTGGDLPNAFNRPWTLAGTSNFEPPRFVLPDWVIASTPQWDSSDLGFAGVPVAMSFGGGALFQPFGPI